MSQTKIEISNLSDSVISALAVPKILSLVYPGDDTAASPTGGQQITINGSGFATGALVYVDNTVVGVSSIISGSQIVFTSPVKLAGSYEVKVVNLDGGVAMSNMFMQYSGTPAWSTPSGSLATVYESSTIANTFSATSDSAVTYSVTSGSLPAGGTLNSATGALTGTASSVASSTTYSFTVDAVDAEQQETPRNFSYTINPDVVTWSTPAAGATLTGTEGTAYTQALSASSAAGKTISYSANALPSGLSISGSSITGTPSTGSSISSLITATAAITNKTATRIFNWSIASFVLTKKAIFGYGRISNNSDVSITNLVSNTGVVASDTTGVGTARDLLSAASYGSDKAIFGYGYGTNFSAITNLVSNTGVVATDTAGVGTGRYGLAAAGYGTDKAIFGYGATGTPTSITNLVSNTGVVATDTTGVGTARQYLAAASYGTDKAIFGYGQDSGSLRSMTNLVSNTGVVATDTTGVGTVRTYTAAAGYGTDKAIFGYGFNAVSLVSTTNRVSNTGVVATETSGVGTARGFLAAAGYGTDKAIFGYGLADGAGGTTLVVSITNLVSNTGVVATDTSGVGTARQQLAAASYSS